MKLDSMKHPDMLVMRRRATVVLLMGLVTLGSLGAFNGVEGSEVVDLSEVGGGTFARLSTGYLGTPQSMVAYEPNSPRFQTVLACGSSDGAVITGEADGADLYPLARNSRYIFGYSSTKRRLYRSTDGASWSACGPTNLSDSPFMLVVIPSGPHADRIIRFSRNTSDRSPFWSDDDGNTWTVGKRADNPSYTFYLAPNSYYFDMRFWGNQYSPSGVLIVADYGPCVYRSQDDGVTWDKVFEDPLWIAGPVQSATSTTIQLDSQASSVDNFYKNRWINITSGAGAGQSFQMTAYNGTTRTATISGWSVIPQGPGGSNPSQYRISEYLHIHALGFHPGFGTSGRWFFNTGDQYLCRHCYVSDDNGTTWNDYASGKVPPDGHTVNYLYDGHPTRVLCGIDGVMGISWLDLSTWEFGTYATGWPALNGWQVFKHDGLYYAIVGKTTTQAVMSVSPDLNKWVVYHRVNSSDFLDFEHFAGYAGGKLHLTARVASGAFKHFAISPARTTAKTGVRLCPQSTNLLSASVAAGDTVSGLSLVSDGSNPLDSNVKHNGSYGLYARQTQSDYAKIKVPFTNTLGRGASFQGRFWARCKGPWLYSLWTGDVCVFAGTSPDEWREYVTATKWIGAGATSTLEIALLRNPYSGTAELWVDSLQISESPTPDWHAGGTTQSSETIDRSVMLPGEWTHIFSIHTNPASLDLPSGNYALMSYVLDSQNNIELYWNATSGTFVLRLTENGVTSSIASRATWFLALSDLKFAVRRLGSSVQLSVVNGGVPEHVSSIASLSSSEALVGSGTIRTGWRDGSGIMPCTLLESSFTRSYLSDTVLNASLALPIVNEEGGLTLSASPVDGGSIQVTPSPDGNGKYAYGTVVTLTATAATGHVFASWSGDVAGTDSTIQVTITGDKTVVANFAVSRRSLSLASSPTVGGSIQVSPDPDGQGTYILGSTVTMTAVPSEGYHFECWSGDVAGTDNPTVLTMDANKSVRASFSKDRTYSRLSVFPNNPSWGQVTITPAPTDPQDAEYVDGTVVTLSETPAANKNFGYWIIYDPNYPGDFNYATTDANQTIWLVMNNNTEVDAFFSTRSTCGTSEVSAISLLTSMVLMAVSVRRRWRRL